jgi:hypothetical protein
MAQDQRRDGLQGHEPLHRQLPRKGRALETARRPPRQDIYTTYREAIRVGPLAHREYAPAPAVRRGLTDEQRKALDTASAAARATGGGGMYGFWAAGGGSSLG